MRISSINVFTQCAHATGHGFLAWKDHDLLGAQRLCDDLGAIVEGFPFFNCYDAVFMENYWGVHNGAPSPKRWLKADDPYYSCTDPRIPTAYLAGCWANQATVMNEIFHGDLKKVAEGCDGVKNPECREACYTTLFGAIAYFAQDQTQANALRRRIASEEMRSRCLAYQRDRKK